MNISNLLFQIIVLNQSGLQDFFRIMSLMERMTKNLTLDEKSRGTLVVMYTIRNLKRFYKYLFNLQVFLETLH